MSTRLVTSPLHAVRLCVIYHIVSPLRLQHPNGPIGGFEPLKTPASICADQKNHWPKLTLIALVRIHYRTTEW